MASRNRGRKKPKLSDFGRLKPTLEEVEELFAEFNTIQSPIVAAILGQALVEIELDTLLRARFVRQDDDTWELLTDITGPLSSFYAKITAGYAFGTFDPVVRDGLHKIRLIRNAFAHSKVRLDFSNPLILRELQAVPLPAAKRARLYKKLSLIHLAASSSPPPGFNKKEVAQKAYCALCAIMATHLIGIQQRNLKTTARRLAAKSPARAEWLREILGTPPKPRKAGSKSILMSQSGSPNHLTPKASQRKPRRSGTTPRHNKGKK